MGGKNKNINAVSLPTHHARRRDTAGKSNCDFTRATFENTNIEKADFRTSFNYSMDPEINRIKKAKFSLPNVIGF